MNEYTDDECRYLGGDPRLDGPAYAVLSILPDGIQVSIRQQDGPEQVAYLPTADIRRVEYDEQRLGMEQAETEEGVLIGDHEWLTRHTVVVNVRDPESAMPGGFPVRFAFKDEYRARVFEKRCSDGYKLPPSPF